MRHEIKVITLALAAAVAFGACSKKQPEAAPPPTPAPTPTPTPTPPPPARTDDGEAERARIRATLMEMINYDFDRSDIRPDARAILDRKVPLLRADPSIRLRIEGHADERGSAEYNLALGMRRANSAKQYLVGFGLDESRFETVSYGEERPLDSASNEAAWARNRRAEFHITSGPATSND